MLSILARKHSKWGDSGCSARQTLEIKTDENRPFSIRHHRRVFNPAIRVRTIV